jgi:hypothetical protein
VQRKTLSSPLPPLPPAVSALGVHVLQKAVKGTNEGSVHSAHKREGKELQGQDMHILY